jgi:hypothetical protein
MPKSIIKKALEFNSNEEEIRVDFAAYYEEQRKFSLALQQYHIVVEKKFKTCIGCNKTN